MDSDDELDSFTLTSSVRTFTFNVVWHFIQCRGWKWVSVASIKDKASLPSSVIKGANVYVAPPSDGGGIFADGNDVVNYLDGEGQGVELRREFLKSVFEKKRKANTLTRRKVSLLRGVVLCCVVLRCVALCCVVLCCVRWCCALLGKG